MPDSPDDLPPQDDQPDPAHGPLVRPTLSTASSSPAPSAPPSAPASRRPSTSAPPKSRPFAKKSTPSVHSDKGDGHKFNLKDLISSGHKISRKSSQHSVSSRHSGSDAHDTPKKPKSTAGESTTSLSQKYGVCQRIAIGKGATSVVRLAHKWDRSEEKLYAVKVNF
jgi:protein-serine/threonine kinase